MDNCPEITTPSPSFPFPAYPTSGVVADSSFGSWQGIQVMYPEQCSPYSGHSAYPSPPATCNMVDTVASTIVTAGTPVELNPAYSIYSNDYPITSTATKPSYPKRSPSRSEHDSRPSRRSAKTLPYSGSRRTTLPVFPQGSIPISMLASGSQESWRSRVDVSHKSQSPEQPTDGAAKQPLSPCWLPTEPKRKPVVVKMPERYTHKLYDIDQKLLRLQADRARLVKQACDQLQLVAPERRGKPPGLVSLTLCTAGQSELGSLYAEEANFVLGSIGGLHHGLKQALENFTSFCSSFGVSDNISDAFAYIQTHLPQDVKLKLQESSTGLIQLEMEGLDISVTDDTVGTQVMLDTVNHVFRCAQEIKKSEGHIKQRLESLLCEARLRLEKVDQLCPEDSLEKRCNLRSVLEGNCAVIMAAQGIWQQYHQQAADRIRTITRFLSS